MNATAAPPQIMDSEKLRLHFQGHRNLTRRILDAFPEETFFSFSIAGMRTPAQLANELLAIGAPGLEAITSNVISPFAEPELPQTKAAYLQKWDEATASIDESWEKLSMVDFGEMFNLFGQYNSPVIDSILYFIDNEIHHRGQMYVYLRALGIEPPYFWER